MSRAGILLAGGTGSRLSPMTRAASKQLLPVYDKPMIYYPLSTLLLAGIRDILVIATPTDLPRFQALLGDGRQWGVALSYAAQPRPGGIAQAWRIARDFLAGRASLLVLGDNLFHGEGLQGTLQRVVSAPAGATAFAYRVRDPRRYGVVTFDADGRPTSVEEKPAAPRSPWAVTGLYGCDATAPDRADALRPSARGELEVADLLAGYLRDGALTVERFGRGTAWLDTGTADALHDASSFVRTIEERTGLKVGCPEEVAWRLGLIDDAQVLRLAGDCGSGPYAAYLRSLVESGSR